MTTAIAVSMAGEKDVENKVDDKDNNQGVHGATPFSVLNRKINISAVSS